jgi:CheY-like chemotaxis protein
LDSSQLQRQSQRANGVTRINLLLGNGEELVNDLIEAAVQEVCAGKAQVKCIRTGQMEDFIQRGCDPVFDLVILIPNNLASQAEEVASLSPVGKGARAIELIKQHCSTPVIALPVFEQRQAEEPLMLEAGADRVLELPFDRRELKAAVSRCLKLPTRKLALSRELAVAEV